MREMISGSIVPNFFSVSYRRFMATNSSFVYGHYQIGYSSTFDASRGFHVKNDQVGYATVGGLRIGDKLYYSIALCSPSDNFSKKIGRRLVTSHMCDSLHSNKRGIITIPPITLDVEAPAVILKLALERHLKNTRNLPSWTKQTVLFRGSPRKS